MPKDEEESNYYFLINDIEYIHGIMNYDFDQYLGPYPMEKYELWKECSNYIT